MAQRVQYRLYRHTLTYAGLTLHTAASGVVMGLDTLYVTLDDGVHCALGEARMNCAYLNGYAPDTLLRCTCEALAALDWDAPLAQLRDGLVASAYPAPVRMLLDMALWDLTAQRAGLPLAHLLADALSTLSYATNQTLFLSPDTQFDQQAAQYVARGFYQLKLRVGQDIAADCARCIRLRTKYGDTLALAADANGAWNTTQALENISRLHAVGLQYIEQPIAAGDWQAMVALAEQSPVPVMLDESLGSVADFNRLLACDVARRGQLLAHLKLIKLGGITSTLIAAQALRRAGISFMVGQMNEGAVATAAALHTAIATQPQYAELYGADGLSNDPAQGLYYSAGHVQVQDTPGLGVRFGAPNAPITCGG